MTRLTATRRRHADAAMLRSTARLRARVLAILQAAQERTNSSQVDIANALGIRKSAVNQVLNGGGNIQIDTLGEYLAAMGLEADLVVATLGEFREARMERRAPDTIALTMADHDRVDSLTIVVRTSLGNGANGNSVASAAERLETSGSRVSTLTTPAIRLGASTWR